MSRIIRVIIQNSFHQNKKREEEIPDLSISYLLSVFVLAQIFFNFLIKNKNREDVKNKDIR